MSENRTGSWWQTIPGILTTIAGIVTALTGLVVALQQTEWFGKPEPAATLQVPPSPAASQQAERAQPASSRPAQVTADAANIQLPDGNSVQMDSGTGYQFRYTILSATATPEPSNQQRLRLNIRAWTSASGGLNFWSDSFRLIIGDMRIKPSNMLNELVARDETKDALIDFVIDGDIRAATLAITVGGLDFSGNQRELKLTWQ